MNNIYLKISGLEPELSPVVLATVISTRGSTPQKHGSSALFNRDGLIYGTIGGGVLEGRIQKIATEAASKGYSGIRHFDLDKDISFSEEAICGGQVSVLIDDNIQSYQDIFKAATEYMKAKKSCMLVTRIVYSNQEEIKITRSVTDADSGYSVSDENGKDIDSEIKRILSSEYKEYFSRLDFGKPGEKGSETVLFESLFPQFQLVIAGAGHIGKALSHLGRLLDFEVTVIDDRAEYANSNNLPDAEHIIVRDIGEAIGEIGNYADTYFVIVTRGHKDDANALRSCLGKKSAYIGMIGSRTKVSQVHDRFIENGWATEEQWAAIHTPIGLEINSQTVEEIAISIAAELVLVRNNRKY